MARILLAEDDIAVRDFTYRVLLMDGHDVVMAHEGQEALRYLTSNSEHFDMMLSDIRMPVIDGVTLSKLVFRMRASMPILLMTGYSDIAEDEWAPTVVGVLQKPFTLEGIQDAVRGALGHKSFMHKSVTNKSIGHKSGGHKSL